MLFSFEQTICNASDRPDSKRLVDAGTLRIEKDKGY